MIYTPPDEFNKKIVWDFGMAMLIAISCIITPYYLAFPDAYTVFNYYFDNCSNIIFVTDLVMCFFTSYHDEDYKIIDDRKVRMITFEKYVGQYS